MKKILFLMGILLSISKAQAQQYIAMQFSSAEDVPVITYDERTNHYGIIFKDSMLTNIISRYEVTRFSKEFPKVHLVKHPNAEKLDRVYHLDAANIQQLYKEIIAVKNGPTKVAIDLLDYPKLLYTPNDYNNGYQAGIQGNATTMMDFLNAPAAWDITHGSSSVLIGINDVPYLRITHEEIASKVNVNHVATCTSCPGGDGFHATMVGGMAAGATNNTVGLASMGFDTKMNFYDYIDGYNNILNAAMEGCRVVNLSWGCCTCYYQPNQDLINLVNDVYQTVIVAGAGNGGAGGCYFYPASYKHVISATGVGYMPRIPQTNDTNKVNWADVHDYWPYLPGTWATGTFNQNDSVDICAPGYYVYGPGVNSDNDYIHSWGTSFSSPIVAGTAALMLAVNPYLIPEDIEGIIKCTAADVYEQQENLHYLNLLGGGRINTGKAVALAQTWVPGTGFLRQSPPTDIKWFEILSDGVNTTQVESTCSAGSGTMCNIGYRLEAVAPSTSQTFKWLIFYSVNGVVVTKSVKYGNSVILTRGVDYPVVDDPNGSLKALVRVDDCVASKYYSEDRASSCFGAGCSYPCPSDITITGSYSTALTESATWVKSSGQTTITAGSVIKVDANPVSGYVLLKPASGTDYFVAAPNSSGAFVAQGYNGCVTGSPAKQHIIPPSDGSNNYFVAYPNPGNGLFTVKHPAEVTQLEVIDLFGNTVLKITNNGATQTKINLLNKPAGVYFLRTEGVKYLTRLIKQ